MPSFVRGVTGTAPTVNKLQGHAKRACLAAVAIALGATTGGAAWRLLFIAWAANLFFGTMELCDRIKEKSGSANKYTTVRLLAEADKVVNMKRYLSLNYNRIADGVSYKNKCQTDVKVDNLSPYNTAVIR